MVGEGVDAMKRDMNLIRRIALAVEVCADGDPSSALRLEGYTAEQIGYHCQLMVEAGLIHAIEVKDLGSTTPTFLIRRLTWEGHEFVDAARKESLWSKLKEKVANTVESVTMDVLIRYLKSQAARLLELGD